MSLPAYFAGKPSGGTPAYCHYPLWTPQVPTPTQWASCASHGLHRPAFHSASLSSSHGGVVTFVIIAAALLAVFALIRRIRTA